MHADCHSGIKLIGINLPAVTEYVRVALNMAAHCGDNLLPQPLLRITEYEIQYPVRGGAGIALVLFDARCNERAVFVELDMSAGVEVVAVVVARFIENDGGKADSGSVGLGAGDFGCGFVVELERERFLKSISFPMGENRAGC